MDAGPVALVALVPLLWAVTRARPGRAALLGLAFGLAHYGPQLSWLTVQTWLGWALYTVWQALCMAVVFWLTARAWRGERPVRSAFAFGAIWAALEWARLSWPFGGIVWADLGATQHDSPLLLPAASAIGSLGLAFLVASVNALVLVSLTHARRLPAAIAAAALVVAPAGIPLRAPDGPPVDVAVIQGSIPERLATVSRTLENRIVAASHARLTRSLASDPPDLLVWPENALDDDPTSNPEMEAIVFDAVTTAGTHALVGAITDGPGTTEYNENLLYDRGGRLVARYRKNHVLPFGEYVPFRRYLGWLPDIERVRNDLTPGTRPGRLRIPAGRFASAICFENVFADLIRRYTTGDMGFVVISTNNASFKRSSAPEQHVALSEMRAVENGRWVVHAALSGISAMIDHRGRVHGTTGLFRPEILRASIPQAEGRTIFNRIGGWLPAAYWLGLALALIAVRQHPRRATAALPADPSVVVVLPTYDERETIAAVVDGVRSVGERVSVIVVDDGSPDGTAEVVRSLAQDRLTLVVRARKAGLASAYAEGFRRALANGADLVVEMDADLSHRPQDLPLLLAAARDHHLVIGSRYVPGGSVRNWGRLRLLLSRAGNLYARLALGLPVRDATSGYRVFRRDLLEHLLAAGITSEGYGFQVELAYRAWRDGFSVGEAPITFEERRAGESKISRGIVTEALWRILRWGIRDRVFRRR